MGKKEIPKVKPIELKLLEKMDASEGFICDVNTGICGPINKEKEKE